MFESYWKYNNRRLKLDLMYGQKYKEVNQIFKMDETMDLLRNKEIH